MFTSLELKTTRQDVGDQAKSIVDRIDTEKRSMTGSEEREYRQLCNEVDRLNHSILEAETREQSESQAALKAYNAGGGNAVAGSRNGHHLFPADKHETAQYREGCMLRSDQSFAGYMRAVRGVEPKDDVTFGDFVRSMVTGARTEAEKRALAEGLDATGGAHVPDYLAANFIDRLRSAMPTMGFGARIVELTSDNLSIARTVSGPTVTWRLENAAVNESDPVFERVLLTPRSLAAYCKISRELFEDAVNLSESIEREFIGAAAVEVERVALEGSGTAPQPRGIRNTTNVNEVSQGTNGLALANWDNVISLIQAIWEDNEQTINGVIMSPRTMGAILKLKEATTNAPLQEPPVVRDIPKAQTSAVSIAETQGSSGNASTLYLGNWSRLIYGFRNQARIKILDQPFATNLQIGFLVDLRVDVALEHPQSFGRLIGLIP